MIQIVIFSVLQSVVLRTFSFTFSELHSNDYHKDKSVNIS